MAASLLSNVTKNTGPIFRKKALKARDAYKCLATDQETIHTMDYFLNSRTISVLKTA